MDVRLGKTYFLFLFRLFLYGLCALQDFFCCFFVRFIDRKKELRTVLGHFAGSLTEQNNKRKKRMLRNSMAHPFPLLQLSAHRELLTPGQCFVIVLDSVTVVRRGVVVNSFDKCWLEGTSQSGRGGKKVDLFPPTHGVPLPLLERAAVGPMTDIAFAAFCRLIPRGVKDSIGGGIHNAAASLATIYRPDDQTAQLPTTSTQSPFIDVVSSTSDTVLRRVKGKVVRIKRERAPCSPPTSIDAAPKARSRGGRPPKPLVAVEDPAVCDTLRAAIDIIEERVGELHRTLEAVIEKVADMSKDFRDHEQILIQKGFY